MSCDTISASTPLVFHPSDNQNYAVNFTQFGLGLRTIASVGTISSTPTGLTFNNKTPNTGVIDGEQGQDVDIGKAVQFDMTGGTADLDYIITIPVTLSDGDIMNAVVLGECRAS